MEPMRPPRGRLPAATPPPAKPRALCAYCGLEYAESSLYRHYQWCPESPRRAPQRVFKCGFPGCSKQYSRTHALEAHYVQHDFTCKVPGCSFENANLDVLWAHAAFHVSMDEYRALFRARVEELESDVLRLRTELERESAAREAAAARAEAAEREADTLRRDLETARSAKRVTRAEGATKRHAEALLEELAEERRVNAALRETLAKRAVRHLSPGGKK